MGATAVLRIWRRVVMSLSTRILYPIPRHGVFGKPSYLINLQSQQVTAGWSLLRAAHDWRFRASAAKLRLGTHRGEPFLVSGSTCRTAKAAPPPGTNSQLGSRCHGWA